MTFVETKATPQKPVGELQAYGNNLLIDEEKNVFTLVNNQFLKVGYDTDGEKTQTFDDGTDNTFKNGISLIALLTAFMTFDSIFAKRRSSDDDYGWMGWLVVIVLVIYALAIGLIAQFFIWLTYNIMVRYQSKLLEVTNDKKGFRLFLPNTWFNKPQSKRMYKSSLGSTLFPAFPLFGLLFLIFIRNNIHNSSFFEMSTIIYVAVSIISLYYMTLNAFYNYKNGVHKSLLRS